MMRKRLIQLFVCMAFVGCGTQRNLDKGHVIVDNSGKKDNKQEVPVHKDPSTSIVYDGTPWVTNVSKPYTVNAGLNNTHLSVWASHGRYYNNKKGVWEWQRPYLYCTTEDLFTRTIVVPFLIPMLENAGANVFMPLERDMQTNEEIVDNDDATRLPYYTEVNMQKNWEESPIKGFANVSENSAFLSGDNPFQLGTSRMIKTVRQHGSEISYMPRFPESGSYAVYVSYPTLKKSVSDAQYIVYHQGKQTEFRVNQQMGGGTWVYLGHFIFDKGCSMDNRVVVTNISDQRGVVGSDAVRFGGGTGNIARGGITSGMPRCLEGARYYAQWAGAPDSVYNGRKDTDDYSDDINTRAYMTNWLAGGSCFVPQQEGLGVPIEMSLAVHSDAGVANDYKSLVGSLSICTTGADDGYYPSGLSRQKSKTLATNILDNLNKDLSAAFGNWTIREVYDRNYSECKRPAMPSSIIETLSHQNFPDMRYGMDPNFRFTLARSIYKTLLRNHASTTGKPCVVTPLAPCNPYIKFTGVPNEILIGWQATADVTEKSARPTGYVVYTSVNGRGFDNGTLISSTSCRVQLVPDNLYCFKVTAVNDGGESFASETLSAYCNPGASKTIMVVNGFRRLSAPQQIDTDSFQGFDIITDPGVEYGSTMGFSGKQICFDKSRLGIEGEGGLGFSGSEMEGKAVAGNSLTAAAEHVEAIAASKLYNVVSCSRGALENGLVELKYYHCTDIVFGLEKDSNNSLCNYKTFTEKMQQLLSQYTAAGGRVMASGSYLASDMLKPSERQFMRNVFHVIHNGTASCYEDATIRGMGTQFDIYSHPNEYHYAANRPDVIDALAPAFCALTYPGGSSSAVAYKGNDCRTFAMGFPLECIKDTAKRNAVMKAILSFLLD